MYRRRTIFKCLRKRSANDTIDDDPHLLTKSRTIQKNNVNKYGVNICRTAYCVAFLRRFNWKTLWRESLTMKEGRKAQFLLGMLIGLVTNTVYLPPRSPSESYDLNKGGVWGCERDILSSKTSSSPLFTTKMKLFSLVLQRFQLISPLGLFFWARPKVNFAFW